MTRYVIDASVIVPAVRTSHEWHVPCYSFVKNNDTATWLIPPIAYFEYQATQSRRHREEGQIHALYRDLFWPNAELYPIDQALMQRSWELDLFNRLAKLHGADLIYACIAVVENVPLVTRDNDFNVYRNELQLIDPTV